MPLLNSRIALGGRIKPGVSLPVTLGSMSKSINLWGYIRTQHNYIQVGSIRAGLRVKGRIANGGQVAPGAFKDFALYPSGALDPAMSCILKSNAGAASVDNTNAPTNFLRAFLKATVPADYPVSGGGYAWRRAAYAGLGVKFKGMINGSPASLQYVDGWQNEITDLASTAPTPYAPARAIRVDAHANRKNLAPNPAFRGLTGGYVEVRRNVLTNPAFRNAGASTVVRTNLFTNPSFRIANANAEMIRNYCLNPNFETDVANWSALGSAVSRDTTTFRSGTASLKMVASGTPDPTYGVAAYASPQTVSLATNTPYQWRVSIKADRTMTAKVWPMLSSAPTSLGGVVVNLTTGWNDFVFNVAPTAAATNIYLIVGGLSDNTATINIDNVYFGLPSPNGYFDGSTATTSDQMVYSWTGTANESQSIGSAPNIGAVYNGARAYQSAADVMRILPGQSGAGSTLMSLPAMVSGFAAGDNGAVRLQARAVNGLPTLLNAGTSYYDAAGNGTGSAANTAVTTLPTSGAWTDITLPPAYAAGAGTTQIGLLLFADPSSTGQEIYEVRRVLVEKVATTGVNPGPYFDGATIPAYRRNLSTNPRAVSGAGGFYSNLSNYWTPSFVTGVTGHPLGITTAARVDPTSSEIGSGGTIGSIFSVDAMNGSPIVRGFGAWVWSSVASTATLYLDGNQSATQATTTVPANTWTFCTTAAASSGNSILNVIRQTGTVASGDYCMISGVIAEENTAAPVNYFDGSTPSVNGIAYSWDGTANTSASRIRTENLTYAWTGTTNGSTSTASGLQMTTWAANQASGRVTQGPTLDAGNACDAWGTNMIYGNAYAGAVGDYYSGRVTMRAIPGSTPAGSTVMVRIHDGAAYVAGSSTYVALPADGSPLTIDVVSTSATTGTAPRLYVYANGTGVFRITNSIMSKVPGTGVAVPSYFDGNTAGANGLSYSWTAGVDVSASVATGSALSSVSGTDPGYALSGVGIVLPGNALGYFNDSYESLGGDTGGLRLGMLPGGTYTISATGFASAADSQEYGVRARSITVFVKSPTVNGGQYVTYSSPQVPVGTAVQAQRVSVTVTLPADATEAFVRLYNGSMFQRLVTWQNVLVEATGALQSYFDGSSGAEYLWESTTDNSPSYYYQNLPVRRPLMTKVLADNVPLGIAFSTSFGSQTPVFGVIGQ